MAGPGDNSGWSSDGGSPDDLPDLPEEWGVIVIPDDLSELDDEVEAIRAEFRLADHPSRWHRFANRPAVRTLRRLAATTLRAPALIISLAALVTVASLFASAWPGPPRQPAVPRTTSTAGDRSELPALELIGADGRNVPVRGQLPAVILFIERCDCARLVADTVNRVRPEIAVITIVAADAASTAAGGPPTGATPQAQGKTVRVLRDPAGEMRRQLGLTTTDDTAAVVLVEGDGGILRTFPRTAEFTDFEPYLPQLFESRLQPVHT